MFIAHYLYIINLAFESHLNHIARVVFGNRESNVTNGLTLLVYTKPENVAAMTNFYYHCDPSSTLINSIFRHRKHYKKLLHVFTLQSLALLNYIITKCHFQMQYSLCVPGQRMHSKLKLQQNVDPKVVFQCINISNQ